MRSMEQITSFISIWAAGRALNLKSDVTEIICEQQMLNSTGIKLINSRYVHVFQRTDQRHC